MFGVVGCLEAVATGNILPLSLGMVGVAEIGGKELSD